MPYRFAFIVGFIVVTMPGCLHHGNYSNGYNYGTGPSVLQPQPWNGYPGGYPPGNYPSGPTYTPGAPYSQPGAPLYPPTTSPTPINGGNGTFTPTDPLTPPNSQPDSGNPSTYEPNSPPFRTTPNNGNGVPDPGDDPTNGRPPQGSQGTTLTPTSGARAPAMETPFEQEESRLPRKFEHQDVAEAEDESAFESPLKRTSNEEVEEDVQFANRETLSTPEAPRIYGYDPKFQWIKGVVDFDEPSGTWVIMYDDNPSASDEFGGELALGSSPKLNGLKPGDKVRIEGSFDPDRKDSRGLNLYQPNRIKKQ